MNLLAAAHDVCAEHGFDKTYWLAYSGGLDSHVLLDLFHALRCQHPSLTLRAIHIHHGLSQNASTWAAHCARVCAAYQIELVQRSVHIEMPNNNLEETARSARYAAFAECMSAGDVLLTAHHQEDQAETVLIQLMRGAGTKGLGAMPRSKKFARGFHGRPLLQIPRSQLVGYANERQLQWVEDESNLNTNLARNFIRHEILPQMKLHWPAAAEMIARSGAHCAESQALLAAYAIEDCKNVCGARGDSLSVKKLLQLSPARQRLMLRTWIEQQGFRLPDTRKITAIQQDVFTAAWDRLPLVCWEGAELRRYRDDLFLMPPLTSASAHKKIIWDLSQPLAAQEVGLRAEIVKGKGLRQQSKQVSIQFRRGGEMAVQAKRGTRALKKLFQEWDVLPWERARIPLIFAEDKLISVVGYFLHEDYAAVGGMGWEIIFM